LFADRYNSHAPTTRLELHNITDLKTIFHGFCLHQPVNGRTN
jgi:hypothetical protein